MSDEISVDEQLAEQQLLQEYVRARIGQAMEDLERLQAALQADPKNFEKANKLMKAFADVRALRTELNALSTDSGTTNAQPDTSQATNTFRAAQAQKAEKIMQEAGMRTKECEKCHAILPDRAALCFCGNRFAQAESEPATKTDFGVDQLKRL